ENNMEDLPNGAYKEEEIEHEIASFNEEDKDSNTLNDEIMGEASNEMKEEFQNDKNTKEESDAKEVFESRFVNEGDVDPKIDHVDKENNKFANPFNIYDILNKNQGKSQVDENSDSNLKYPLRFTPAEKDACFATKENNMEDLQNGAYKEEEIEHGLGFVGSIHAIINKIRVGVDMSVGLGHINKVLMPRSGGSILELMD
ncbi:hypothetical protein Tco_0183136, partial [Tanacetum coccineum]